LTLAEVQRPQPTAPLPAPRPASPPAGTRAPCASTSTIRLHAMRERGHIVDFIWQFASPAAAQLLHCDPRALIGRRLRDVVAGPLGHPALINRYRRVIDHGGAQAFAQVHLVDGRQDIVVHRVVRLGDGVAVTLTNLSADRRAQAQRLEMAALAPFSPRRFR